MRNLLHPSLRDLVWADGLEVGEVVFRIDGFSRPETVSGVFGFGQLKDLVQNNMELEQTEVGRHNHTSPDIVAGHVVHTRLVLCVQ